MSAPELYWLPEIPDWRSRAMKLGSKPGEEWSEAVALAGGRLDFTRTNALDDRVQRLAGGNPPKGFEGQPMRLAILGSSTVAHLRAAIRIAGLRRRMWISTYEADYGQYLQELSDPSSALHAFRPTAVLFAFDARHLFPEEGTSFDPAEARERIRFCWKAARDAFGCLVLQQTVINSFPTVLGLNEHRLPESRSQAVSDLNIALRSMADAEGVDLVALDRRIENDGLAAWHDPALWCRTKQDVRPTAAPVYGDLVARLLAARQGRSAKCLVLDLDNTLWGGVIGDDGLAGIVLGQGTGEGEGYLAVQNYARALARRGIILAACSKNDEENAWEPFDKHPEMALRRDDIVCLQANWDDKPRNIRTIAEKLNIGIDSLVFLDDNPFERSLVRQELPMVAVPEFPEDPALVPRLLADAGYFEGATITKDDRGRAEQYRANLARESFQNTATDLDSYLRDLGMQLVWQHFDRVGLARTAQLINKTNQFNLTTRRYTEEDVLRVMADPQSFGLQLRLLDRFGDNGIISIIICRMQQPEVAMIDSWLMSCRVLGRQVEQATLNLVVQEASRLGATRLLGEYLPTSKNGMVKDHYRKLGFVVTEQRPDGGSTAELDLTVWRPLETSIETKHAI